MMGCPIGIDWSVARSTSGVRIGDVVRYDGLGEADVVSFPGLEVVISEDHYRQQIVAFANAAKELFVDQEKVFADDFDRQQHTEFWVEYNQRLARVAGTTSP